MDGDVLSCKVGKQTLDLLFWSVKGIIQEGNSELGLKSLMMRLNDSYQEKFIGLVWEEHLKLYPQIHLIQLPFFPVLYLSIINWWRFTHCLLCEGTVWKKENHLAHISIASAIPSFTHFVQVYCYLWKWTKKQAKLGTSRKQKNALFLPRKCFLVVYGFVALAGFFQQNITAQKEIFLDLYTDTKYVKFFFFLPFFFFKENVTSVYTSTWG